MFRVVLAALVVAFACVAKPSLAADVSAYGRLPAISNVTLSPSGDRLAFVSRIGADRHLIVLDLPEKPILDAPLGDTKIRDLEWAGDGHLLVTLSNTREEDFNYFSGEEFQSLSVNVETKKTIPIFENDPAMYHAVLGRYGFQLIGDHWYGFFAGIPSLTSSERYVSLYRVDLDTDQVAIQNRGNLRGHDWALDANGVVMAISSYNPNGGSWELHDGAQGHRLITTINEEILNTGLEGQGRTPGTVLVMHDSQPEEWILADGSHTLLPIKDNHGVDAFFYHPTSRLLIGVVLTGDAHEEQFFDPVLDARYHALQKAFGPTVSLESWSADYKRLVVKTEGKGDSGTYWLIDGGQAKIIDNPYPDVTPSAVGESQVIDFKAADGLDIHGILTLPTGRDPKHLPIVVMPHGGPEAHDTLAFDWMAQAFVAQGYAVFQPNFRGSDGYLDSFRDAGFGEWGRKMQTDISDGLAELVRRGVADARRACIVGASYGGYAALAGVTVQHGLYRCAVSYAGVTDLNASLNSVEEHHGFGPSNATRYWRRFMGVTNNDDPSLRALSPARLADSADAPVLLIYGTDDTVVPIEQSQMMEKALRAAGKPVETVVLKNEDHWLSREAGRKTFLAAAVDFVIKNNPPDPAPAVAASATAPGSSN